jgi:phenylacetate-CoA ligase
VYSKIAEHFVYPLGDAVLHTNVTKYLASLEKSQWWSLDKLVELQNQKLRSLIDHAYNKVPYYRRVFDERGLSVRDIQSIDDLPKLPLLTKDLIRQDFTDFMAQDYQKWRPYLDSTSGSTGVPLHYYTTMDAYSMGWACLFRGWSWAGYRLGDKRVTFGGSSLAPSHISLKNKIRYGLERNLCVSSFGLTADTLEWHARRVARFSPRYLRGYPSTLAILAEYLIEQGRSDIRPRAVFTTAESLLPSQRRVMEAAFGCEVLDQYGLNDGGAMALECSRHQGYHVAVERAVVEVCDAGGRSVGLGGEGQIITTDLHNCAMPFIRYATGDMALMGDSPCTCGRMLPLLKSILGRRISYLVLNDGTSVPGLPVTDVFEDVEQEAPGSIRQYQVVQEVAGRLRVKIVKGAKYTDPDTERIKSAIAGHSHGKLVADLEFVDDIPATAAGKRAFVTSKVIR